MNTVQEKRKGESRRLFSLLPLRRSGTFFCRSPEAERQNDENFFRSSSRNFSHFALAQNLYVLMSYADIHFKVSLYWLHVFI
jgi:hypothetical protein